VAARTAPEQDAHAPRQQYPDQGNEIRLLPVGSRQSEEELLAVLHADAVEEERETERPNHRRRHRLGREPADEERDEQDRTDTEGEPLDVDLARDIPDGDREKQRHQGLLLEQRREEFHKLRPATAIVAANMP
jgi:hypothetical protein